MSTATEQTLEILVRRSIDAPRERVFDAWLDPEILRRWFAPSDDMSCEVKILDPRVGGRYHIEMLDRDGVSYNLHGEYVRIDRPNQLAMTFYWVSEPDQVMLATVSFSGNGDATEIELRHEKLPGEHSRDAHRQGWNGTLARLQLLLES